MANDFVLIFIATGRYSNHVDELIQGTQKFLPRHDTLLFTDSEKTFDVSRQVKKSCLGFPNETLLRYHTILGEEQWLSQYKSVLYIDVDTKFIAPIDGSEIFSEGITATFHPGYKPGEGTPESRKESTAYLSRVDHYYYGAIQGGKTDIFLGMAKSLRANIDEDRKNGLVAIWHDESHLNNFLFYNPPTKIITIGSKIRCINKRAEWKGFHR